MAASTDKKSEGIVSFLLKKVLGTAIEKIAGIVLTVSAVVLFLAWVIDQITASLRIDTPLGPIALPQTTFFAQALGFLQQIFFGFFGSLAGALIVPAIVILILWLTWRFMNWAPKEGELKIYQRMMNALFHGVHAGARKGGGLTVKGARRGLTAIQQGRAEAAARRQVAMLAALDEESFPIEEDGLVDGLEALDVEQPAFPLPPETLRRKQPGIPLPRGRRLVISMKRKRRG